MREHFDVPQEKIDFYMGTFSKSFASVGGYVAGKRELVEQVRSKAFFYNNKLALSPVCAQ